MFLIGEPRHAPFESEEPSSPILYPTNVNAPGLTKSSGLPLALQLPTKSGRWLATAVPVPEMPAWKFCTPKGPAPSGSKLIPVAAIDGVNDVPLVSCTIVANSQPPM